MEYFSSEKVALPEGCGKLTMIRSKSNELMYLVEGTEKAVLIDTCIGIRGLRALVEKLTDKPLTVLISHGHLDHAMGVPEFESAYMNHKDISLYQSMCSLEERKDYAELSIGPEAKEIPDECYLAPTPDYVFEELTDGMSFDLGGMHIDVHEFPGHTKGCMVFLLREAKILICGDACNNSTFLFDDYCSTVAEYRIQVEKIMHILEGKYNKVFTMHEFMEADPDLLAQMILVCDDVMNGRSDELPFEFMGKQALVAKDRDEKCHRFDGGYANLVYNPERINLE